MGTPDTVQLAGSRVLVTGAGGFIGNALARRLAQLGAEVTASSRRPGRIEPPPPGVQFIACDLRSPEQVDALIQQVRPKLVFHMAAHPDGAEDAQRVRHVIDHNIGALANLLNALMTLPAVTLVYSDSAKVFGNGGVPYRSEQTPDPLCSYAVSKLAGWQLIDMFRRVHGLQAVGLRPTLVYGPSQGFNLFSFLVQAVHGGRETIALDGGVQTRDPLHIDDVVEAFVCAAQRAPLLNGRNLPVGGNREISVADLAALTVRLLGGRQRIEVRPANVRPTETLRSWSDNAEAQALLGWQPRVSLEDGIRSLAQAMLPAAAPGASQPAPAAITQGS